MKNIRPYKNGTKHIPLQKKFNILFCIKKTRIPNNYASRKKLYDHAVLE